MKEILEDLDRWQQQGEQIGLATLVAVRGAAPRLPGARLALTRSAGMAGSVSGGCVENDVFERALKVLDEGAPVLATYGIADDPGFGVGLSCGGAIDVLIEPFQADPAWQAVRGAVESGVPGAWAVGLAPAPLLGRRLAIVGDAPGVGSIDPALDREVVRELRDLLPAGGTRSLVIGSGDAATTVFLEAFPPAFRLFIVGATDTGIHLCRMASQLGFRVTVLDARAVFARAERFPEAEEVLLSWPDEVLGEGLLDAGSYVVTLTHDFKIDLPALACALRSRAPYVGALGSRATHARRSARLLEEGFTEADLARIRAPIGLDLGARAPQEIALSILAEMLAVRHGREGGSLCRRKGAIHAGA